jgi:hypothetical protein
MNLKEAGYKGVEWIHVAQDRDEWRRLTGIVMNFRISNKAQNSLTERLLASQEELCPTGSSVGLCIKPFDVEVSVLLSDLSGLLYPMYSKLCILMAEFETL